MQKNIIYTKMLKIKNLTFFFDVELNQSGKKSLYITRKEKKNNQEKLSKIEFKDKEFESIIKTFNDLIPLMELE